MRQGDSRSAGEAAIAAPPTIRLHPDDSVVIARTTLLPGAPIADNVIARGSVFGCKPAPSIKLATNTAMYRHIEDDTDVNRGTVVDGDETVAECGGKSLI